jgi:raffinose/stachyose/melibiose transport system substrate-binding protein
MIEGGYALDASEITNEELKTIYNEIPTALRLTADDETGNYGIPYNIEGYGLIANETILADIFGLENATQFETDYKAATYEEFETMVVAVNNYINGTGGESITLKGNTYTTATEKTDATSELNGVFAIAGAEKWTYGNHYSNYALNAVFPTFSATANATADEVSSLESVLTKSLEELEFLSQYTAGQSGAVSRGADYINSTITGYDQAVQTFAAGKAVFIKQGNWIYSTVAETDAAFAENLTMLPMKVNFEDSDVTAEGMSVEKMNASVPEFVSQYYVINAKATDEEIAAAEEFLIWLNTTETGSNIIINDFAFVPYNADDSVKLDNPLSNDLISYKNEQNVLCNAFDAFPTAWGTDVFGAYIQENLFTTEGEWTDEQIQECVDTSINSWLESIN